MVLFKPLFSNGVQTHLFQWCSNPSFQWCSNPSFSMFKTVGLEMTKREREREILHELGEECNKSQKACVLLAQQKNTAGWWLGSQGKKGMNGNLLQRLESL